MTSIKRVLGALAFLGGAAVGLTGMTSVLGASPSARDLMPEWYVEALTWMIFGSVCAVAGLLVLVLDARMSHQRDLADAGRTTAGGTSKARTDTVRPLLGGLLAALAGYLCLLGAFAGLIGDLEQIPMGLPDDGWRPGFPWIVLMAFLSAPFGLGAMIAGSFAIFKQEWGLAFGGAVLGAVGAAMVFWLPGAAIGLTGAVLIFVSQDEFT